MIHMRGEPGVTSRPFLTRQLPQTKPEKKAKWIMANIQFPSQNAKCPVCLGTYEHDQNCELKTLPIEVAYELGLERARLEVKRRAKHEP
jgi:hypothetical protein